MIDRRDLLKKIAGLAVIPLLTRAIESPKLPKDYAVTLRNATGYHGEVNISFQQRLLDKSGRVLEQVGGYCELVDFDRLKESLGGPWRSCFRSVELQRPTRVHFTLERIVA